MLFKLLLNAADTPKADSGIFYEERLMGYSEITARALKSATVLADFDVQVDSVVAVMLDASADYIVSLMSAMAIGATVMPLNPKYERTELSLLFKGAPPAMIITHASCVEKCRDAMCNIGKEVPILSVDAKDEASNLNSLLSAANLAVPVEVDADADAFIFHSSGSTGRSKLIRRTHRQIMSEVESFAQAAATSADDVFFSTVPLYHAHGFGNAMLAALRAQAKLVLFPTSLPAILARDKQLDMLQEHKATIFPAVPMTFEMLAKTSREVDLSSLRLCFSAGTNLPATTFQAFQQRFGIPVRQLYGCSEGGALALNTGDQLEQTWETVGKALPNVRFKIIAPDEQGIGDIAISSPSITRGYDNLPETNATCFVDGWFLSGDRGRLSDDGYLYVTNKRALYIETGGHKVDPYEIEDVLNAHAAVAEVAVVADNHSRYGTLLKAVVVTNDAEISTHELRQHCLQQLVTYKVPQIFEFRDELPKSPLGKVLKKYLV